MSRNIPEGEINRLLARVCPPQMLDEAKTLLQSMSKMGLMDADTYLARGTALFHLGRDKEALVAFEHAIRDDPTFTPSATGNYAVMGKGTALLCLRRPQEALAAFELVIRFEAPFIEKTNPFALFGPCFGDAYLGKGLALVLLAQYKEALTIFERAIQLGISNADAYAGIINEGRAHLGKSIALQQLG